MNEVKMNILLMFANVYSIVGEGRLTEGCTINYYPLGEHGELLEPKEYLGVEGPAGLQRAKASLPKGARADIRKVPGIYEATFEMKISSDGKFEQKPLSLEYIGDVEFNYIMREKITDGLGLTTPREPIKPEPESRAKSVKETK